MLNNNNILKKYIVKNYLLYCIYIKGFKNKSLFNIKIIYSK